MAGKTTHRNRIRDAGRDANWEEWVSPNGKAPSPGSNGHAAEVAGLAYTLWQERGCPDGSPEVDWFRAEAILSGETAR